jgi:HTH-type transcriptional regulator/antitoxin HigA
MDGCDSLIEELSAEIKEYDELKSGNKKRLACHSLVELPHTLIKARIARRLTHKELGEMLHMPEQQIQRYEATEYEAASFARLVDVATVLNLEFSFMATLPHMREIDTSEEITGELEKAS